MEARGEEESGLQHLPNTPPRLVMNLIRYLIHMFIIKIKSVNVHKGLSTVLAGGRESVNGRYYYYYMFIWSCTIYSVRTPKAGFASNASTSSPTAQLTKFTEKLRFLLKPISFHCVKIPFLFPFNNNFLNLYICILKSYIL